jgi:hypothetical protein
MPSIRESLTAKLFGGTNRKFEKISLYPLSKSKKCGIILHRELITFSSLLPEKAHNNSKPTKERLLS